MNIFPDEMLGWIKPERVSTSALLYGGYLLQPEDVEIAEEFLTECLGHDLSPIQGYMTTEAWAALMEEKINGICIT